MAYTLENLAEYGIESVTCIGVLWLIISSLVTCCIARPITPEPLEPPREPIRNSSTPREPISRSSTLELEAPALSAAVPLVETAGASPTPANARMYFLDNLKAFLTVVVICHHVLVDFQGGTCTGAAFSISDPTKLLSPPPTVYLVFSGIVTSLNQSYFMALFFLISGYFTPSSLDRKGIDGFLRDRFKRIGIPAVVYTFFVGPFQIWLSMALGKNDPDTHNLNGTYLYAPFYGQCWYLHWLVLLSVIYAFIHKEPLNMKCPQVSHIFLFAFGIGTWFVLQPWGEAFAMVPGGFHSLFYYILYFAAGIVAKRNDWMTEIMKSLSKGGDATTFFLWGSIVFFVIGTSFYKYSISGFRSESDVNEARQSADLYGFSQGCCAVLICLAELQFFYTYFNQRGRISNFFCESAYGAYILHFLFLNLGIDIYFRAMKQFSGLPDNFFVFWQALGQQSTTYIVWTGIDGVTVGQQYTWFGMLFVCAFTNLCSFSLAFFLRKLPLLNQLL